MKVTAPYICDVCKAPKGATNHWWLLYMGPGYYGFTLGIWKSTEADLPGVEHICSEACAAKSLSRWMARQSTAKTEVPA